MDELERALSPEERSALIALAADPPRRHWGMLILAVALVCVSLAGLAMVTSLTATNNRVHDNQQAIRVSCTLLVNAIIQSGARRGAGRGPQSQSPQQELTALYVGVIARHMTPNERRSFKTLAKNAAASGQIEVPDCDRIARHPEAVTVLIP
jgi:hypothetical protein